jgi:transposase
MTTATLDPNEILIDLRQQANYWRALHARAVEREAVWKAKAQELEAVVRRQATQLQGQAEQIEALKAQVVWLQQQVFGQKSEASALLPPEGSSGPADTLPPPPLAGRGRGQQRGAKGHGRQRRVALPTEEIEHVLPAAQQQCPQCGLPLEALPSSEDSEEIHWEVRVVRRVHKRRRYRPTCRCGVLPGIVTAPVVPKVIRKGLFSTGFWVQVLMEKYLFQRPLYRVRQRLALEGLSVSQGTLTGGLQRLGELLQPLYARILERSRAASHWQMDETRWMVFAEVEGKQGHQWWLWVVLTVDTCAYLLDPSRSSEVPKQHLGEAAEGILNVDRYAAYKALGEKIRLAFCWSHIRRDFVRIREGYDKFQGWAEGWIERINGLFQQNRQRLAARAHPEAFAREDQALRSQVAAMAAQRDAELAEPTVPAAPKKALESLQTHWEGATLFVDHPEIPMDNNEAERCLRNPVVGRKNYYGSGAVWSGMLSAILFTLFQTYLRNQLDPQQFLLAYFDACAQQGGRPPEALEEWLPWNLSEAQKRAWAYPKHPP